MHITRDRNLFVVTRTPDDKRYHNESHLMHAIKVHLNTKGYDLIKKLAYKDGHMLADTQHYLRSRHAKKSDAIIVWDEMYSMRDLAKDFRATGVIRLNIASCHDA